MASTTLLGGGGLAVAGAYQVRKGAEAGEGLFKSVGESADKSKELAKIVVGGALVLYGMYLFSKYR